MSVIIYHNPACSKSKQTLALLQQQGIEPQIITYLQHQFSLAELLQLKQQLALDSVRQMMRTQDDLYQQLALDNQQLTEQQLCEAIIQNPRLLQRPIVVNQQQARIGRPPEAVLEIL